MGLLSQDSEHTKQRYADINSFNVSNQHEFLADNDASNFSSKRGGPSPPLAEVNLMPVG